MNTIHTTLDKLVATPSDINEHLMTLQRYGKECSHITEMGVRNVVSTWAFLSARPKKLICIDINQCPIDEARDEAAINNIAFEFRIADSGTCEIEQTDLLFIDTWHCYAHLTKELALHPAKVNKFIILHDTTSHATYDETWPYVDNTGGAGIGIWRAVEEFLAKNSEWKIVERYTNNNGLTILGK